MSTNNNVNTSLSGQTGTGNFVGATSPTLVTPVIGVATASSVNKMAITAPGTSSTLAVADGKTLTASNTLTFTGTDGSSVAFGAGGTVLYSTTGISQVVIQVFTANGTYTPTSGMKYCIVECVGGGGGGGGVSSTSAIQVAAGGGGGGGEYARSVFTAATIGVSKAVAIGAAGTAGANTGGNGGTGGNTTLGTTLIIAVGGGGGNGMAAQGGAAAASGGTAGTGGTGTALIDGGVGMTSIANFVTTAFNVQGGGGGNSFFGQGGASVLRIAIAGGAATGSLGNGYGSGGGGAANLNSTATGLAGSVGIAGYMIITEFV